jgi:hypothetical protein
LSRPFQLNADKEISKPQDLYIDIFGQHDLGKTPMGKTSRREILLWRSQANIATRKIIQRNLIQKLAPLKLSFTLSLGYAPSLGFAPLLKFAPLSLLACLLACLMNAPKMLGAPSHLLDAPPLVEVPLYKLVHPLHKVRPFT